MFATLLRRLPGAPWLWASLCLLGLTAGSSRAQDVVVQRNVVYYDGPEFYAPRHVLDVYRLDDEEIRPVLLFIHGGGWTGGNKSSYSYLGNFFARQGYVTVVANYRLTDNSPGRVTHPGHVVDVARSFAWTYSNILDYGGNPDKIFISGHSAGGHLVSLLATDPRYLKAEGLTPAYITGVISISGVYDVRGLGAIFGTAAQQRDASPQFHVGDGATPPFLVLYAEFDLGNLAQQAIQFYLAMIQVPGEIGIIDFPGRTHSTIVSRIANPDDEVAAMMLGFMAYY